ncbi:tRNA dihydrouridine(20/20a) synthase DusA [Catenovulum sp. SM1970]|uniref:tRNA dihydrouridine(20/20a) synthase DusA n=1 Tax=Marinifaba aquimaris TaxID=2741323 RepID=UPI0015724631|nr:tRNA dihydrouridine(20/20a) synthase DusA [Marinifaba aquimaris]NTS76886.1 tRNA dihydrouridine(20/20a) synthase DusA [Marinifaba aquimaris]
MTAPVIDAKFSVAPMLDWTDRHCRYFYRIMSKKAVLYTEMVTTGAILHGKADYLAYHQSEHPLVLQLGGSDPEAMSQATQKAEQYGYDEVNINVGCPSDRVQNGAFGACLMAEPSLVADNIVAMKKASSLPVTVKTRIGIDDFDSYAFLTDFVEKNAEAGCNHFIVHARKAWLKGLSPKQNREIPELNYDRVYQLKKDYPELLISINGGIETLTQAKEQLAILDGVMIGRAVYQDPYMMTNVDELIYGDSANRLSREAVVEAIIPYVKDCIENEERTTTWHIARHMLGLFNGQPGARQWRRFLSENARHHAKDENVFYKAMEAMHQRKPFSAES